MMSADSLVYKVAIVEELPLAEGANVWDIVSIIVGVLALILSVYSIYESRKRDNTRKLKDYFISELEDVNGRLEDLVKALTDSHTDITCQEVITSFKHIMMKMEVVLEMAESSLKVTNGWDSNSLKLAYNEMRTCVTDAESFTTAYANKGNVTLNISEMNNTYSHMMNFYKKLVEHIRIINSTDSLKKK